MQLRPTVLMAVSNRLAFLQAYYDRSGAAGLWVNGPSKHELGTHVDLEIAFAEEQIVLHTRGVVRAKRPADRGSLRAGIGIDLLPSESKTRDLILSFARGRTDLVRRRSRRLPIVMDVEVLDRGARYTETTEDFSREGALITHPDPPPDGTKVSLVLKPRGPEARVEVQAEARWGRRDDRPAMGVRFLLDDPAKLAEITALVEDFRSRLAV